MSRVCTVCSHPKVSEINEALLGSEAYRSIAKRFGASQSAMYRHQQEHLPQVLVKAKDAAELLSADNLLASSTTSGPAIRATTKPSSCSMFIAWPPLEFDRNSASRSSSASVRPISWGKVLMAISAVASHRRM